MGENTQTAPKLKPPQATSNARGREYEWGWKRTRKPPPQKFPQHHADSWKQIGAECAVKQKCGNTILSALHARKEHEVAATINHLLPIKNRDILVAQTHDTFFRQCLAPKNAYVLTRTGFPSPHEPAKSQQADSQTAPSACDDSSILHANASHQLSKAPLNSPAEDPSPRS
ncbi:hypothetical protein CFELI_10745 [Corynebacterium felinum]|nr:hypothetical protein CFELI_10745 [Corynebacterium felinum]